MDLHIHTTASDGEHTPREVVEMARQAGVTLMAVTDHDTIDGLAEALEWGEKLGITVVPGLEINAQHEAELHILGYGFDWQSPDVLAACQWFHDGRERRGERILALLGRQGVKLTMEEVRPFVGGRQLGRPHFARALVDKGYAANVDEAFKRYLSGADFQAIEREKMAPQEAIELITAAGGLAVLAHPASLQLDAGRLEAYIKLLKGYGLQGMECYYSANIPAWTKQCLAIARKNDLLPTGGTDFHGSQNRRGVHIGSGRDGNMHFDSAAVEKHLLQETYWGQRQRG